MKVFLNLKLEHAFSVWFSLDCLYNLWSETVVVLHDYEHIFELYTIDLKLAQKTSYEIDLWQKKEWMILRSKAKGLENNDFHPAAIAAPHLQMKVSEQANNKLEREGHWVWGYGKKGEGRVE